MNSNYLTCENCKWTFCTTDHSHDRCRTCGASFCETCMEECMFGYFGSLECIFCTNFSKEYARNDKRLLSYLLKKCGMTEEQAWEKYEGEELALYNEQYIIHQSHREYEGGGGGEEEGNKIGENEEEKEN